MNAVVILGIIAALIGLAVWSRRLGAAGARAEQIEAEHKAKDIADQVQNDVGALPPKDAREELKRWSR